MGKWAKSLFGQEHIGDVGLVVAGTSKPEVEKATLSFFDEIVSSKDSVYHAHLVKKNGITYPIVFNAYGAPAVLDVLAEMHDGGCRNVVFVGYAYGGFNNLDIGSIVIPTKAYHFEGLFHIVRFDKKFTTPDELLQSKLEKILHDGDFPYILGTNISVPAVTFQIPHSNKHYQKIRPSTVEMELGAFYYRAKEIGIRAVGALIISDNRTFSIGDPEIKKRKHEAKERLLQVISNNLSLFKLPELPVKKAFNIDEHLAGIIHDPANEANVYAKKFSN